MVVGYGFLSLLMYLSATEFRMRLRKATSAALYVANSFLLSACCLIATCAAKCPMAGSASAAALVLAAWGDYKCAAPLLVLVYWTGFVTMAR